MLRVGRGVPSVAGAILLHLVVLVALRATLGERPQRPGEPAPMPFDVSFVELDAPPGVTPLATADAAFGTPQRLVRAAANPERLTPDSAPAESDSVELTGAELAVTPDEAAPNRPIDLGLGPDGWQRWVAPPGNEAPKTESKARRTNRFHVLRAPPTSTTGGVQEALEERDRARGLGPAGRVLSALHDAAHTSVAPVVGTARFDVTVDRTGAVNVALANASGELEKWRKVAAHVAKDLRAAPPRIPPPREGVKLVIELVAEAALPNGTKPKSLERPHLDVTPPKLESGEEAMKRLSDDNPTMKDPSADIAPTKLDLPGAYVAGRDTVCSYRAGAAAIGHGPRLPVTLGPVMQGGCDPANLGAKAQRMVRARVIEQALF